MKVKVGRKQLPKFMKSVVIIGGTPRRLGSSGRLELVPKRRRRRRSKGMLGITERIILRRTKAAARAATEYRRRHRRSNRKRRDGWLRDLTYNALRASRKGAKINRKGPRMPLALPFLGRPPIPELPIGPPKLPGLPMLGPPKLPGLPMLGPPKLPGLPSLPRIPRPPKFLRKLVWNVIRRRFLP